MHHRISWWTSSEIPSSQPRVSLPRSVLRQEGEGPFFLVARVGIDRPPGDDVREVLCSAEEMRGAGRGNDFALANPALGWVSHRDNAHATILLDPQLELSRDGHEQAILPRGQE